MFAMILLKNYTKHIWVMHNRNIVIIEDSSGGHTAMKPHYHFIMIQRLLQFVLVTVDGFREPSNTTTKHKFE